MIGMPGREPSFQCVVRVGELRMAPEIVAEIEVPLHRVRIGREGVNMMRADADRRMLPEVASPRNAELAERFVPERVLQGGRRVEFLDRCHDGKHVDHRLRDNTGDRGAADVVQGEKLDTKGKANLRGFVFEEVGPPRIVRDEDDWTVHFKRLLGRVARYVASGFTPVIITALTP